MVVKFISDTSTLANALLSGEIDGAYEVPTTSIPALKSASDGKLYFGPSLKVYELFPAGTTGPMANPQIRRALSMAIDRAAIANKVFSGAAIPNKTLTPATVWDPEALSIYKAAWDALPSLAPDVAAAKQLVAGQPGTTTPIVLACLAGSQTDLETASIIQQAGAMIGLNIRIKQLQPLDFSNFFYVPQYRKGINLAVTSGYLGGADPLDYIGYFFGPAAFFNMINYHNPTVLKDVTLARETFDPIKRAQLITQAQKIYMHDEIVIPLENDDEVLFMNNRLTGAVTSFAYLYLPSLATIGAAK